MSYIDGDKPPQETAHSEGQSKSKSENSGMSIMEINDLLDREAREEKVRLWKASLENFKADMEKGQRGEKPVYSFRSIDELKTAPTSSEATSMPSMPPPLRFNAFKSYHHKFG